jgi:hypothetical protein
MQQNQLNKAILFSCFVILIITIVWIFIVPKPSNTTSPAIGSLSYRNDNSSMPISGKATFEIALGFTAHLSDIKIVLFNNYSMQVINFSKNWTHIVSDDYHIISGDRLTIELPNTDIRGYEVVVSIDGYRGILSAIIPGGYRLPTNVDTTQDITTDFIVRSFGVIMVVLLITISILSYRHLKKQH